MSGFLSFGYKAQRTQPSAGAPVVRNQFFNTCPLHQRKYFWKCEACDREHQRKGRDTPISPAPEAGVSAWDYSRLRCQGVVTNGFQCPDPVAPRRYKYCDAHGR
jgi:hypothetical protein